MATEILTIGIPTLAVLVGILVNNSRLSDLRGHMDARLSDLRGYMDARFNDLRGYMDARFNAVDQRFNAVDQRFTDMEAVLTEKLLRVEQVLDARLKHLEENR